MRKCIGAEAGWTKEEHTRNELAERFSTNGDRELPETWTAPRVEVPASDTSSVDFLRARVSYLELPIAQLLRLAMEIDDGDKSWYKRLSIPEWPKPPSSAVVRAAVGAVLLEGAGATAPPVTGETPTAAAPAPPDADFVEPPDVDFVATRVVVQLVALPVLREELHVLVLDAAYWATLVVCFAVELLAPTAAGGWLWRKRFPLAGLLGCVVCLLLGDRFPAALGASDAAAVYASHWVAEQGGGLVGRMLVRLVCGAARFWDDDETLRSSEALRDEMLLLGAQLACAMAARVAARWLALRLHSQLHRAALGRVGCQCTSVGLAMRLGCASPPSPSTHRAHRRPGHASDEGGVRRTSRRGTHRAQRRPGLFSDEGGVRRTSSPASTEGATASGGEAAWSVLR